jgi:hypothetical protein
MPETIKELWENNPEHFDNKTLFQILAFTADGKLSDGNSTSKQFREWIEYLHPDKLSDYINECLDSSEHNSYRALQDLINEIGKKLGFDVEFGLYKGKPNHIGNDGLWKYGDTHTFLIETKTTTTFPIKLSTIADYRKKLIKENRNTEENSSILLVVGKIETDDIESQIRGSRFAWNIRLISVEALLRLLKIKLYLLDNEDIFLKICQILKPVEYTRLDNLVDIIFETSESIDCVTESAIASNDENEPQDSRNEGRDTPSNFTDSCIAKIQKHFGILLKKQTRTLFDNKEEGFAITCSVSKNRGSDNVSLYWFGFHEHQEKSLGKYRSAYVSFGCGDETLVFVFGLTELESYKKSLYFTERNGKVYWHIKIEGSGKRYFLLLKNKNKIDITDKMVKQ